MKKFNDNTVIATGIEMNDSGLFPHIQPTDKQILLWINWHWSPSSKKNNFAPIVDITNSKIEESTHKITGEEMYFKLTKNSDGVYMFEEFINKFVAIEIC